MTLLRFQTSHPSAEFSELYGLQDASILNMTSLMDRHTVRTVSVALFVFPLKTAITTPSHHKTVSSVLSNTIQFS